MKLTSLALILLTSFSLLSQTASEIIDRAENAVKGNSAHGEVEMTVVTPDYTRSMKMESWWVGNEKALILIKSPRREAGNKTLKIKNEMWNYLKNTETTIKIPPSMMLQSWNGSDFTNDDLVRESNLRRDYEQKLVAEEELDGELCYKIELIPRPDAPVVWGKLHYWVRKADYLPALVKYYDENDRLVRSMSYHDVRLMDDRKMPTMWKMTNQIKTDRHTEFRIISMEFDVEISDRIFSFRELER